MMIEETTRLIVALMRLKGVSRSELARRLNTSRSNITQLLNGDRNMTLATLENVMMALGVESHIVWIEKKES